MPKPKVKKEETTTVLYPEVKAVQYTGEDAMTPELAKEILGWEEESDGVKFGENYLLKDIGGRKIRCTQNAGNRPFDLGWAKEIMGNVLRKQFKLNGETIVVDKQGIVRSGQHRLVGFVLAEQERTGPRANQWEDEWKRQPITIETIVVFGIDGSPETIRTLDNVKPRSLADEIYADETIFGKVSSSEREALAKSLEAAIKKVRYRSHCAYIPKRTHSESLEFLARHGRLKNAVKHIHTENKAVSEKHTTGSGEIEVRKTVPLGWVGMKPGVAAGLLYLMGCSGSDGDKYVNLRNQGPVTEKKLDWGRWDLACKFWSDVMNTRALKLIKVRDAIASLEGVEGNAKGSAAEREAIILKSWNCYVEGLEPTDSDLELSYKDVGGIKVLLDNVTVGGIDFGRVKAEEEDETETGEASEDGADDPTPEEIEDEKERIRAENATSKPHGRKKAVAEEGEPAAV